MTAQPLSVSPEEFSDLIANAWDFDANRDALFVYNSQIQGTTYYMLELVWATNEVKLYLTPDSKPIIGKFQLSITPTTNDNGQEED